MFSQSCHQSRRQARGPTLGLLFGCGKPKPKVSVAFKAKVVVKPAAKPAAELSFSLSFFGIKSK